MEKDKKYESDLTKREKIVLEWENIKKLRGRKLFDHIWAYYKPVLVVLLILLLIIITIHTMVMNNSDRDGLNLVIVDLNPEKDDQTEKLRTELSQYIASDESAVYLNAAISSIEDSANNIKTIIALSSNLETNDVVICSEAVFQRFHAQGAFKSWEDILDTNYNVYGKYIVNGAVDLTKSNRWADGEWVTYSPAYLCLLSGARHTDAAVAMLPYFFE